MTETGLLYYGWVDLRMMLAPEMRGLGDGFDLAIDSYFVVVVE